MQGKICTSVNNIRKKMGQKMTQKSSTWSAHLENEEKSKK